MMTTVGTSIQLDTLDPSGAPPKSRLTDVPHVRGIIETLLRSDTTSSYTRSKLSGLVDGNPPYHKDDLEKNGQAYRANINFREAESMLMDAVAQYYDVVTEVPYYFECQTAYGDEDKRQGWSEIITKNFDWLNRNDSRFDFVRQMSLREMVMFGAGPVVFPDLMDFRCTAIRYANLLVPSKTKSNVEDWELCVLLVDYAPHELYAFIEDKDMAERAGWNYDAVVDAIRNAAPPRYAHMGDPRRIWEAIQIDLRANDFAYSYGSEAPAICVAHVLYREFDGSISQKTMMRKVGENQSDQFLFDHVGRYKNWNQVISPCYYDRGDGTHRGVKGLGIKMFGILDVSNKLKNAFIDAAFDSTSQIWQPATADAQLKMNVIQMGPRTVVPAGFNYIARNEQPRIDSGLSVDRYLLSTLTSNTSQYRQNLQQKEGNPITAREVAWRAEMLSALNKTGLSRFYEQWDDIGAERFRRASNPNVTSESPGGELMMEFQDKCEKEGVPKAALLKMEFVRTYRAAGQGSQYLRQAQTEKLLSVAGTLPEPTRVKVMQDFIAATVGTAAAHRYPVEIQPPPTNDTWEAHMENVAFKSGVPDTQTWWTPQQSNVAHLDAHLLAAGQAIASLEQGGDPMTVVTYMESADPNIAMHLNKLSQDAIRKPVYEQYMMTYEKLTKTYDKIKQAVAQQVQQQAQSQRPPTSAKLVESLSYKDAPDDIKRQIEAQAGFQPSQMPSTAQAEIQMKAQKAQADMDMKQTKQQHSMSLKDQQVAQKLELQDKQVSAKIAAQAKTKTE